MMLWHLHNQQVVLILYKSLATSLIWHPDFMRCSLLGKKNPFNTSRMEAYISTECQLLKNGSHTSAAFSAMKAISGLLTNVDLLTITSSCVPSQNF